MFYRVNKTQNEQRKTGITSCYTKRIDGFNDGYDPKKLKVYDDWQL